MLAEQLSKEAKDSFGRQCQREMEWLEARGLDADYLPEVNGEERYWVAVEPRPGTMVSQGSRHYEWLNMTQMHRLRAVHLLVCSAPFNRNKIGDKTMMEHDYEVKLPYHYSELGGCDTSASDILQAVWQIHYRIIAAHDDSRLAGSCNPVYDASQALVIALMGVVYQPLDGRRVYEVAVEIGELPSKDQLICPHCKREMDGLPELPDAPTVDLIIKGEPVTEAYAHILSQKLWNTLGIHVNDIIQPQHA